MTDVKLSIKMDINDILMINEIARQLDMDFDSTVKLIIRRGVQSLIRPVNPNLPSTQNEVKNKKSKK